MTEPANVTTDSGTPADGEDVGPAETGGTGSGHGDPSAGDGGGSADADTQSEH